MGDHVEVTVVDYDPKVVSFEKLLDHFWDWHDATAIKPRKHMSYIWYHDEDQKVKAYKALNDYQKKKGNDRVLTLIEPVKKLYLAEDWQQKYMLRRFPELITELGLDDKGLIDSHVAAVLNAYCGGYLKMDTFSDAAKNLKLTSVHCDIMRKNAEKFVSPC